MHYAKTKIQNLKLGYFFPFGSIKFNDIEFIGDNQPQIFFFCFDQEPIDFNFNMFTFQEFDEVTILNPAVKEPKFFTYYSEQYQNSIIVTSENILRKKIETYDKIKQKIPTILLNTEQDSEEKDKILKKFNYIDCYYFFHALAAADWFRGYQYCYDITPIKERNIKKTFITFNRITGHTRIHRALFVTELLKKNLIDSGHISFSKDCPVHGNLKHSMLYIIKKYNLDNQIMVEFNNQIDSTPTLRIDTPINQPILNSSFSIGAIPQSMESFVHVVTETCFWDTKKHLTEKIFKPIVLKQPFLLLGCTNNLSYLKNYGFKTFNRWWDESYDSCNDPIQRIKMVVNILEDLNKLSNSELEDLLKEMEDTLEYNYNLFFSKQFIDHIWNELKTNLDHAIVQALHPNSQEIVDQIDHDSYEHIQHV